MIPFRLPDLGEGLHEAELVEWRVRVGDEVVVDQPLLALETEKAIVDVPSPRAGRIARLHGEPGDVVGVGSVLVEYEGDETAAATAADADKGTVVGEVTAGDEVLVEHATPLGGGARALAVKATPAVRALAHRLDVDLATVTPSGADGLVTRADVERVASLLKTVGPIEPLRGPRRTMARRMSMARDEVVPATVCEDADVQAWKPGADVTVRLVRAVVAGCRAEPALNAWYDSHSVGRRLLSTVDLAIAVDTGDGLFVPVLRDVAARDAASLRAGLDRLQADVRARTIPAEEMRNFSFVLSNFGTIAGRYAAPVVLPPTVAILSAGVIRETVVAVDGAPAVHRLLPLSLTFDHRAVTGGEAGRFLRAAIDDLEQPE